MGLRFDKIYDATTKKDSDDFKSNAAEFRIKEFGVEMIQKNVAINAMTKTVMDLEKWKDALETERMLLLQTNQEVLLPSCLKRNYPGEKPTLKENVPHDFIGTSVRLNDAVHNWCNK